ncbi:hypothetical protein NX059_002368 [Plenodomus lindquistii]|nr:hypothetical protein NX059_002368 [Plenodomus lindquistii]
MNIRFCTYAFTLKIRVQVKIHIHGQIPAFQSTRCINLTKLPIQLQVLQIKLSVIAWPRTYLQPSTRNIISALAPSVRRWD